VNISDDGEDSSDDFGMNLVKALSNSTVGLVMSNQDFKAKIHKLQIHQIELEKQNMMLKFPAQS